MAPGCFLFWDVRVLDQLSDTVTRGLAGFVLLPHRRHPAREPSLGPDGHTYSRRNILRWLKKHASFPMTRQEMHGETLLANRFAAQLVDVILSFFPAVALPKDHHASSQLQTRHSAPPVMNACGFVAVGQLRRRVMSSWWGMTGMTRSRIKMMRTGRGASGFSAVCFRIPTGLPMNVGSGGWSVGCQ